MDPADTPAPRKPRLAPEPPPPPAEPEPERKRYGFRQAEIRKVNTNELPPVDVYDILQTNLRAQPKEKASASGQPAEVYRWRRTRDYWLTMVPVNLAGAALIFWGRGNPLVWLFGLSGLVVFDLSFSWVMWVVLGRH